MTLYTVYFRADNEAAFAASWPALVGHPDTDHIGSVITTAGVYDDEGVEITPPVVDSRHHVNLLCRSLAEAQAYQGGEHVLGCHESGGNGVVFGSPPGEPQRRFAGV